MHIFTCAITERGVINNKKYTKKSKFTRKVQKLHKPHGVGEFEERAFLL